MEADRLAAILRLRRMAVDSAREAMAGCIAGETKAAELTHSYERLIWRQTEAASQLESTDLGTSSFAKWLPLAAQKLNAARTEYEHSVAETFAGRACLRVAQSALAAIEELWNAAKTAERIEAERRSLADLDEIVRSRPSLHEKEELLGM